MSKEKKKQNKPTAVGGQALIEGIMMNGPKGAAIAVRRLKDKEIVTEFQDFKHIRDKIKILGWPFIRGIVNYIETMIIGYKSLMRSADLSGQLEDDEDPENMSKLDRWISDHMGPKMLAAITGAASILATLIGVGLFVYFPTWFVDFIDAKCFGDTLSAYHALFEGILRAILIVLYMFAVSRTKDIHRVFMYHGAEHKTICCYEKGMELTVENVRSCRRFHPRCGTSFLFVIVMISIIVSSIISICFPVLTDSANRILWICVKLLVVLPVVTGISYEFIRYAGRHDNIVTKIFSAPGLWMQRITTSEPDDEMIEVGIASLKAVLDDGTDNEEYTGA